MLITCNAKINIGLEILNKRTDNYHNINTIFHKICLADELVIENSEKFEFIFNSDLQIAQEKNIVYKAILEFMKIHNLSELPLRITVNKNIPAGGGLGGGSTDAAAVLKGLSQFFGFDNQSGELIKTATILGSDIPFFLLENNSAIGKNRGEKLISLDLHLPYHILLIMPGIHISTAAAYQSLQRTSKKITETNFEKLIDTILEKPEEIRHIFKNNFELPVFKMYPELTQIKKKLYDTGAFFASMSGSGSTMYGFYYDTQTAKDAVEKFSNYRTHICYPDSL
jgi:4-diphosphocytidyl-2-C-methyl-D-erythritol kinase